jgi:myo-inositol 2-dehydrogenase/D-chiro-inositol 1-dehydrogenase
MSDLRLAVIGVGKMGSFHVDSLTRRIRGAQVTVVSDFSPLQAEKVAAPIGARTVADPFEAIGAADVDAVVLASPGFAHEKQVLACLDRGIPVLCEKPLTMDGATSYEVVKAQAALGRELIQVGFMRRFDNEYRALRELIESGRVGAPLMLHCTHRNPDVPDTFTSEMAMADSVVHEADCTRFLLGEEVVAVSVIRGVPTSAAPEGVSDPMVVLFETESGRLVTVESFVRTQIAYEVRTELVAEKGSAFIGLDQNLQVKQAGPAGTGIWGGTITPDFVARFGQAYDSQMQTFVDAAREGTVAGAGVWDGYAAAAICEAGVQAVRTGLRTEVKLEARP